MIVSVPDYLNVLLISVPLGIVAYQCLWNPAKVFALNFLAIIPLAGILSFATEELAVHLGETLGGLLNATLGNAVELIVGQRRRLFTRALLANTILGWRYRPQKRTD